MKTTTMFMASAALLWSAAAAADPYIDCTDAYNYGYNEATFYVSAIYNTAKCSRIRASKYEDYAFDVIPTYWAAESSATTPEKSACMLQGSFTGWMDATETEYAQCVNDGKGGFDTIQRRLLGMVVGPLLAAFYAAKRDYYTPDIVATSFAYDFSTWPLAGNGEDCDGQIDIETPVSAGVPGELIGALKLAVCK